MARTEMTDTRIVKYAVARFQFYLAAGDKPDSALHKSIAAALQKHWRRIPPNMTNQRNIDRYGTQFTALQALVMAENGEMACS